MFNDAVGNCDYIASVYWVAAKNGLESMCKIAVVMSFKTMSALAWRNRGKERTLSARRVDIGIKC